MSNLYGGPTANLVAHWKCDDNAANTNVVDSIGGVNLTANANTNTLTTTGKHDQALTTSGVGWSKATHATLRPSGAFTWSVWAVVNSTNDWDSWAILTDGGWTLGYGFWFEGSTGDLRFFAGHYNTNAARKSFTRGGGGWHHFAGLWDGTNVRLYIDGVEGTASTFAGPMSYTGADTFWSGQPDGKQDDLRLYNVALSATEIAKIAAAAPLTPVIKRTTVEYR